ncbi:MAG TPA: hypothetical protein PKA64_23295 [Myxococcota bacterium]|nr:hypothetical protein [Myxococcota bacterium]
MLAERINVLKATTDRLQAAIADLEARIAEARPVELTEEDVRAYVDGLRTLLTERPLDEQRAFLRAWVKEVTATGKDITVHYTLPGSPGTDGGLPVVGGHGTGRPTSRRRGDQAARGVNQIRRVLALGRSGAPGRDVARTRRIVFTLERKAGLRLENAERRPVGWRAREWRRMLDVGVYRNQSELARGEGVSTAAVSIALRALREREG